MQGGQPLSNIQHRFWKCNVVGLSCQSERIILSTEVNLCPLGKRIARHVFYYKIEVVNGGVTLLWIFAPIFTLVLGITISVLAI
ncbi:hypothetical protein S245_070230, partial [Arachis hypogaea]